MSDNASILKLFWQYDPNGLVVVDESLKILDLNPAFESMFQITYKNAIGFDIKKLIGDQGTEIFKRVFSMEKGVITEKLKFSSYGIFANVIVFKIPDSNVVAGIFVDITSEEKKKRELLRIKLETIERIRKVVMKQMEVAQEIASLLGETTAQTKASLLNLLKVIRGE